MMRRVRVGVIAVLLTALSSVCPAKPLTEFEGERDINITVSLHGFSPKTINVLQRERVNLVITSEDVNHGFAIREFGIEEEIKAKQTKSIELKADKQGRFQFVCSAYNVEGHNDTGNNMIGELIVTPSLGGDTRYVDRLHAVGESITAQSGSRMNVTFDSKMPGVVFIESRGERIRIDTATKTVERVSETTPIRESNTQTNPPVATKERESSKTTEPYDYHIVNVPTPKGVRRGSLNMYFTHRFQEPITAFDQEDASQHIARISKDLLGLDSSAVSSFGVMYGITDRLYVNAYRSPLCQPGLCKTIELGLGYHLLNEAGRSPIALSAYGSVEGDYNFTERYTYNLQAMIGRSLTRYVNLFFSPAVHLNSNGNDRFKGFLATQPLAMKLRLGRHTGSFGFGLNARVRPTTSLLFEYTPRVGFEMGQIVPDFDPNVGQLIGFKNNSEAEIAFGIEKRIGRHVFSLTFSNTQATTTARYNSSNQALPPNKFSIGFNLFRRLL
jgi:cytochrome c oxidase subunit 2